MNASNNDSVTVDGFLGGRVEALQPARGHHRSGLEAVMLGAALPVDSRGLAVDLGAGAGIAGFCAAARCPALELVLAEREPALVGIARRALERKGNSAFASRVRAIQVDIFAGEAERMAAGLPRDGADYVLCNPPFRDPASGSESPSAAKRAAHFLSGDIQAWIKAANWLLRPGGMLILVTLAESIADAMRGLERRFGAITLLPIHARPDRPAERLLLRAIKGRRTAPSILPGLFLHGRSGNDFTAKVEAMLRDGAGLAEIHPPWQIASPNPSHT